MNINENIIIDDNNDIIAINNPDIDSNIPMEFFNKNLAQDEVIKNFEEENKSLKRELTLIQEKFSIIHTMSQHQGKLIEFLFRLDLMKSSEDESSRREVEDLQRKIALCSNLIEECNINFRELCNHKRRVLLNNDAVTSKGEKRAAIWEYFTVRTDRDGQKTAECNFCGCNFIYKTMNANKCREHIHEKCEKAPDMVKTNSKPKYESPSKSKYSVWNYFMNAEKDGKSIIVCAFCHIEYSSRNATKCREHLAFKCTKITEEEQMQMRSTFSPEHIDSLNINKRSSIWEHFNIFEEDDKTVIQCIYCCLNYANKNATKCREHLLERCEKIPLNIRHQINHSFYETPTKTWTQIKIPIWKHFSVINLKDRKQFRCNYCKKDYASKNVTKFRLHLLCKCNEIPDEIKEYINGEVTKSIKQNYNEDSLEYMDYDHQMMNDESDNNDNDTLSLVNETDDKSYTLESEEKDDSIENSEKYSLRKKVKLEILEELQN